MKKEKEASNFIKQKLAFKGDTAVVLGSGLGAFTDTIENPNILDYSDIPHYPISTIEGHCGQLVSGKIDKKEILIAKGRVHLYEGYSMNKVIFPIQVFNECGIKNLIITNSAGSIQKSNSPGTLMIVDGMLDCTFIDNYRKPKLIKNSKFQSKHLRFIAKKVASSNNINIAEGIYCWVYGPSYETPAEIDYFKALNGAAVGMSTYPEILEAGDLGMNVLTFSLLSNYAAGISDFPLKHSEVLKIANKSKDLVITMISGIIKNI